MAPRPQPYTVEVPEGAQPELAPVLEGIEQNFRSLFNDVETVNSDIPLPGDTVEALTGTGDAGEDETFSRSDHTHTDANRPTDGQAAALLGTSGTPSNTNRYVTDAAVHATRHSSGGVDPVTVTNLAGFPGGTATFLRADGTFAAAAGSGYWTPLTDGDVDEPALIFASGECIMVFVP